MKSMSNILLVGADGYIGSNCPIEDIDKCDIKRGSDFLTWPIQEYNAIIFLAAAEASIEQTAEDYLYNESLYNRLDQWLVEYPHTHVIFASSAAVYGETTQPSKESDMLAPISLYGMSKVLGEYRVREYARHTVLRFGNVYDKLEGQEGHGATEAFIHGTNLIYGDGMQVRDFVNISMIWDCITDALGYPFLWQGVTNIGTGEGVTINEWYRRWGTGRPVYTDKRSGDVSYSVLDNKKMLQRLELCV